MAQTDNELLNQCRQGDLTAFEELVTRYEVPLIQYLFLLTKDQKLSEQIFKDLFLNFVKNIEHFNLKEKFKVWLFKAARVSIVKAIRQTQLLNDKSPNGEKLEDPVASSLSKLPRSRREAVILKVFLKFPYREISQIMGIPEETVRTWMEVSFSEIVAF